MAPVIQCWTELIINWRKKPPNSRVSGWKIDELPIFCSFLIRNLEDAIAYVMAMDPLPEEFVCVEPLFKRRLRMRQAAAPKETKAEIAQQRAKAGEVSSRLQQKQWWDGDLWVWDTPTWFIDSFFPLIFIPSLDFPQFNALWFSLAARPRSASWLATVQRSQLHRNGPGLSRLQGISSNQRPCEASQRPPHNGCFWPWHRNWKRRSWQKATAGVFLFESFFCLCLCGYVHVHVFWWFLF